MGAAAAGSLVFLPREISLGPQVSVGPAIGSRRPPLRAARIARDTAQKALALMASDYGTARLWNVHGDIPSIHAIATEHRPLTCQTH